MNHWRYNPAQDFGLQTSQRHCSLLRESEFAASLLRLGWLATVRTILKFWNRLEIRGLDNLPTQPPFVVVANHSSHLDSVVLASAISPRWRDHVSPLAAGDYFFARPPMAAFSAVILNALPIWRHRQRGQRHELAGLRERLIQQKAVYIVFPEGSRSRDGRLHEFRPGFATLVAGSNIPVLPCHLSGSFDAMPPDARMVRPRRIRLQIGAPMTFGTVANCAAGWRQIAEAAREEIKTLAAGNLPATRARGRYGNNKLMVTVRFARLWLRRFASTVVRRSETLVSGVK